MVSVPPYVKYRREADGGLVYEHENYGYEDATLLRVDGTVVDILEAVESGTTDRAVLEERFSPEAVTVLERRGFLAADD